MQDIGANICFVLNGVGLPLAPRTLGIIKMADTIAGWGIGFALICKDPDDPLG